MYTALLMLIIVASIPLYRYLLFRGIDNRVQEDLAEERAFFLSAYENWARSPNQTLEDLKNFSQNYLRDTRPEDDNFQIIIIDGELFRSNPHYLIEPISPGSQLFTSWKNLTQSLVEEYAASSDIGAVLYSADPLMLNGEQRGVFVVAHTSAGERQEALVSVYLFARLMIVTLLLSLVCSWLSAGRLMAPIAELSKAAKSVSESDLTQRISPPQGNGELANLANTFNAMMDRIQATFDSQRDFINDAGHELRTPITIMQGHLELLDDDPQEIKETIELVMDELERMGRLVNDMVLLAKSERPDFLKLETIDISHFTEELFAKAKALANRQWILKIEASGQIVGDRQKLTGALLNLLRNATQYTQASDQITLSCAFGENHHICFSVSDTGEGITIADQQRIFSRFARGSNRQRKPEGSGLGLAIVNAVVEAHGGQVKLTSQPGQGATFQITLPPGIFLENSPVKNPPLRNAAQKPAAVPPSAVP